MAEKIIIIKKQKWFFFTDAFHDGVKFHRITDDTVIPIRNANAPLFKGTMTQAIKYVRKELIKK